MRLGGQACGSPAHSQGSPFPGGADLSGGRGPASSHAHLEALWASPRPSSTWDGFGPTCPRERQTGREAAAWRRQAGGRAVRPGRVPEPLWSRRRRGRRRGAGGACLSSAQLAACPPADSGPAWDLQLTFNLPDISPLPYETGIMLLAWGLGRALHWRRHCGPVEWDASSGCVMRA